MSVCIVNLRVIRKLLICERSDLLEFLDEIFVWIEVGALVIANMRCPDPLQNSVLASCFHL